MTILIGLLLVGAVLGWFANEAYQGFMFPDSEDAC